MSNRSRKKEPAIFLSYRIADTHDIADRLAAELARRFGIDAVFFDQRTVEPGETWDQRIEAAVAGASVVLVLIGKRWLTEHNDYGQRRLDLPGDWVRCEVEAALAGAGTVIPVLVDGTQAPPRAAFTSVPGIEALATRQATKLCTEDWERDFEALVERLIDTGLHPVAAAETSPAGKPVTLVSAEADFSKYLNDLWQDTAHIDIRGLVTGTPRAHRFPIEDLYIELAATGGLEPAARAMPPDGADLQHGRAELYRALANPRLVIIGDPGAGKTTFLRWVAHTLAADRLGERSGAARSVLGLDRARLPLLVPIADWLAYRQRSTRRDQGPAMDRSPAWLPDYLGQRAQGANQHLGPEDFRQTLDQGDALILLDGLDEAPDPRQRARAVELIEAVARAWPDCPLVVTSRPAAYRDKAILAGFTQTTIEALDPAAIHSFLELWSQALFPDQPARAEAHRQALQGALEARREIRRMARNTVMLTALAVVHWNQKRLPEQRAELYESIIKWLAEARDKREGRLPAQRCRQLLAELALALQLGGPEKDRGNGDGGRVVQLPRRQAAEWLAPHFPPDAAPGAGSTVDRAEAFLAEEELDSGIVVRRGNQLRFWHLTFQEYLAAQAIAGRSDRQQQETLLGPEQRLYTAEWRETVLLLGGVLYLQGLFKVEGLVGAVLDRLYQTVPALADQARCAGLLGALVRDLAPYGYHPSDPRYAQVLDAAMGIFDAAKAHRIPVDYRIGAANTLARAGDPRLGWLQPRRWVELPGGRFSMGAQREDPKAPGYDRDADKDESPVHPIEVSGFSMARFPVTVFEYAEFVADQGYRNEAWWQAGGYDENHEPDSWDGQQEDPSRPVTGVSWHEASAYCAWLTDYLSRPRGANGEVACSRDHEVRLPTEAEWEYAARGSEGRRYPWGDDEPTKGRANFNQTKLGAPSPVGVFPSGSTSDGLVDLAGNVWEWCLDVDEYRYYQRRLEQGVVTNSTGGEDAVGPRVQRGGAFVDESRFLRATFRIRNQPEYRGRGVGFRCVLASRRQP